MPTVISIEHLSKVYRLGQIGTGTLAHDLNVWWAKKRGKPNPMLRIGETDWSHRDGEDLWALRDVNFTVEQGEVLGIIGRNGAGKSTLLKILSRITAPTSGKIKVRGRVASLLEVGTGFHPELTGRENIYLNGAILGMTRKEIGRKFDEIVDFAEVKKFIDTPVKRYSSGMYVRLAFAVAAHLDPEILVVDEVLAVGDAAFQKKCLGKMGEVAKQGRTVLFVSHNMASIESLCTRSIVLSNGSPIFDGFTADAIKMYLSANRKIDPVIDLSLFRGKFSYQQPILKTLRVFDHQNNPQIIFPIGSTIIFDIEIFCSEIKQPHVGIGFNNTKGSRIFTVSTRLQGVSFPSINGSGHIRCVLRDNPLVPDQYNLKIAIGDTQSDYDIVDGVTGFEIIPNDYLGTGYLPNIAQGVVVQLAEWSLL